MRSKLFCGLMLLFLAACQPADYVVVVTPTARITNQTTPTQEPPVKDASATPGDAQTPSITPTERSVPTATDVVAPDCVGVTFVQDVTVPDRSQFQADEIFIKIWRLRNTGTCDWPGDIQLDFVTGTRLNGALSIPAHFYPEGLPLVASMGEPMWAESRVTSVKPDESIDLPIMFQAPAESGDYLSVWALRSSSMAGDLIQVYVDIHIEDQEAPEPSTWGGVWTHFQQQSGVDGAQLNLEERGGVVRGFYYGSDGELYLLEGGVFNRGSRVEGSFGPPYHDGFHFIWMLTPDTQAFQGSYQDRIVASGAWCGAREGQALPDPCLLKP